VHFEVSDRHLARCEERRASREQSDEDQEPANRFDQSGKAGRQREEMIGNRAARRGRNVEHLLKPVLEVQRPGDDA
jgi:hypothetical protein